MRFMRSGSVFTRGRYTLSGTPVKSNRSPTVGKTHRFRSSSIFATQVYSAPGRAGLPSKDSHRLTLSGHGLPGSAYELLHWFGSMIERAAGPGVEHR